MYKMTRLVVLAGTMLYAGFALAQAADTDAQANLLGQIRHAESIYRDDLVQTTLERLYRIAPQHPQALAAEIRLALRQKDTARARRLLERLRTAAPDSAALHDAETLLALEDGGNHERLQMARLYATAGRTDEALKIFDEVLQGQYPTLELALEYWQLRARVPASRAEAVRQLEALHDRYPRSTPLRQALVNLYFSDDKDDRALALLHDLANDPRARSQAADREYAFLVEQPADALTLQRWERFLATYQGMDVYPQAQQQHQRVAGLMADPAWVAGLSGVDLLDRGRNREALTQLRQAAHDYPDNAEILGSLGLAYQRNGQRQLAAQYYASAIQHEQDGHLVSRWVDLERNNRYWLVLDQADAALKKSQHARARQLYQQAQKMEPGDAFAPLGLGEVALATGDTRAAEKHYLRARRLDPGSSNTARILLNLYRSQSDDKAIAFYNTLSPAMRRQYADIRASMEVDRLNQAIDRAQATHDWATMSQLLYRLREYRRDDPWVTYRLANALQSQQKHQEAGNVFSELTARNGQDPTVRYAHALFLSSRDQDKQALQSLAAVPDALWTADMRQLSERLRHQIVMAQARSLRDQGREPEAIALLQSRPANEAIELTLADWAQQRHDIPQALHYYEAVLKRDPSHADARLGRIETWLDDGRQQASRAELQQRPPRFEPEDINANRRLANAWVAVGERGAGTQILSSLVERKTAPEPLVHRDLARAVRPAQPEQALDHYALAMQDAGILVPAAAQPRDNAAFTAATRPQPEDDWIRSSIRSDAAELYQQRNPTVTTQHEFAMRTDGTPGFSRMRNNTTIVHGEFPLRQGRAFVRAEQIFLDAGAFETDATGAHTERFGHCAASGDGCRSYLRQRTQGTALAVGWSGEKLEFDLGVTPLTFERTNIVGGITYKGDLGPLGSSVTVSRRPMTNSLLSFAGAVDPVSGNSWGGVTANGVTWSLSWDQGGAHGVWANIGHHWLRGHNVRNNTRTRIMGGYYHRLINRPDERLSVGVNTMLWRYAHDLGDYAYGQGGYYSPKRYFSLSLPVSYARRTENWSFQVAASVSWSRSHSDAEPVYPLGDPYAAIRAANAGATLNPFAALSTNASSSSGFGYSLRAVGERRMSNHLSLGFGVDIQKSEDYTPSRAFLYLRYTLQPWRGQMPMAPEPLVAHGEWR